MSRFQNYYEYVSDQAKNFVDEYKEDVFAEIRDGYTTDVYMMLTDGKIHEWVDNDFVYAGLIDFAHIIEQSNNVETDCGLFEGLKPIKAIESQAFYTYKNDLLYAVKPLIQEELKSELSNLQDDLETLQAKFDDIEDEDEREKCEEEISELEDMVDNFKKAIESL
jgi:predicted nuclease with TOPRIM domain